MTKNNLTAAKINKNDEFYTKYEDVGEEIKYYEAQLRGRAVYCNCDNYEISNIYKYLRDNFESLGLLRLTATGMSKKGGVQSSIGYYEKPEDNITNLEGSGDFRSEECLDLLRECDLVITNPPFSLFREFIDVLYSNSKDFLIIGSINAITYKNVFPKLKNKTLSMGVTAVKEFIEPSGDIKKFGNIGWFTNLKPSHGRKELPSDTKMRDSGYSRYTNSDGINIDRINRIPVNYKGILGVPITIFQNFNIDDYEILGIKYGDDGKPLSYMNYEGEVIKPYNRVLIRKLIKTKHHRLLIRKIKVDKKEVTMKRDEILATIAFTEKDLNTLLREEDVFLLDHTYEEFGEQVSHSEAGLASLYSKLARLDLQDTLASAGIDLNIQALLGIDTEGLEINTLKEVTAFEKNVKAKIKELTNFILELVTDTYTPVYDYKTSHVAEAGKKKEATLAYVQKIVEELFQEDVNLDALLKKYNLNTVSNKASIKAKLLDAVTEYNDDVKKLTALGYDLGVYHTTLDIHDVMTRNLELEFPNITENKIKLLKEFLKANEIRSKLCKR